MPFVPRNWATPPRWYVRAVVESFGEPHARPVTPMRAARRKPEPRYVPYFGEEIAG